MDKIYMSGLEFYGFHGVFEEETRLGQRFYTDVVMIVPLQEAGQSDDLDLTVNYGEAYDRVREIMDGEPVQLIETLAERIASSLLHHFPLIQEVQIKVTKPNPPIKGPMSGVAVEIVRGRK
ncbi:dihydroneopterin aldolase [Tumebacillus permanentifrigoris]|uniref:7,8-dihydroneopterin aldolase n=1 Tax=Tumebacillus permanentifrigoris TaxID=378543 RepID=A0A316D6W1_9BACL|nr:dihydroneopterin aldolase [Tumebacillus permanentifrigoris]PWK07847.1 dihydroneopterin aldolase [Tumebacillus permanentifrigoris]